MARLRLSWAGIIIGAALFLTSILASRLADLHLPVLVRGVMLLLGIAAMLLGADFAGLLPMRKYLSQHSTSVTTVAGALLLIFTGLVVLAAYVDFISVGQWTVWPSSTDYYDRLASGFLSGHLSVNTAPDPALVALPNPYDFDARAGIIGLGVQVPGTIWDMSLYGGKVYLYWGPAPAVLLSAVKLILPVEIDDQVVTFAFLAGLFIIQCLLLLRLWQHHFAKVPPWTLSVGMLTAGFMNPAPWLLFSPRIYESAIAAGQFFLIAGVFFAFEALDRDVTSKGRLALAAACWVGAVGSRATLAIPVAFLALMMLLRLVQRGLPRRMMLSNLAPAAAFAIPLLAGAILLGWYNLARFGSPFEFGFRYAITMLDQNKNHGVLFSSIYLPPNAYVYLFNQPGFVSQFPFVKPVWNGDLVVSFNREFHGIYNVEPIVGLVFVAPFLFFALIPPVILIVRQLRGRLSGPNAPGQTASWPLLRWCVVTLSGAALLELLVVFFVFYATMRYFMDATPTLLILSMIGFWQAYSGLESRRFTRIVFIIAAALLALITIAMGVLVGFSSDVARIRLANPAFLAHIRIFFASLLRHLQP